MSMLDQKREELFGAAEKFAASTKQTEDQRAICDAAVAYTRERDARNKPAQQQNGVSHLVPFGRSRNTPIGEATKADLEWVLPRMKETIDDPKKARYREKDLKLIEAIERELETR